MGSNLLVRKYTCDKGRLADLVKSDQRDDASNDGTSYSGSWGSKDSGLRILNKVFTDYDKAEDYIGENSDKWAGLVAVQYDKVAPSAKLEKLQAKSSELYQEVQAFPNTVLKALKAQKSASKKCTKCSSVLTISYLKYATCPVCQERLFSATDTKKFNAIEAKLTAVKTEIEVEKDKPGKVISTHWLAGGWCPS